MYDHRRFVTEPTFYKGDFVVVESYVLTLPRPLRVALNAFATNSLRLHREDFPSIPRKDKLLSPVRLDNPQNKHWKT
jgi:hypothetical protein